MLRRPKGRCPRPQRRALELSVQSRPRRERAHRPEPIAIIGAAAKLPGAPDLAAFAALLRQGVDAVTEVPAERFDKTRWYHPRPGEAGRSYSFAAGTIGDIKGFDAEAFGLSPREVAEADPQQRLLLEVTRDAFEDAGLRPKALPGAISRSLSAGLPPILRK